MAVNERTAKLMKRAGSDGMYIITDSRNVFCLSGFTGEGILLISGRRAVIVTDFRYIEAAEKNKNGYDVENAARGIENIAESGIKRVMVEENNLTVSRYKKYKENLPNMEFLDASEEVDALRLVKTPQEIEKIKAAADIATEAFKKSAEYIGEGVSERDIALKFERFAKEMGASALSFDTIVASGENSSMPHAGVTDRTFRRGDFITLDFGCIYDGYCSDMTRTVALGNMSDEQRAVYGIVRRAQTAAVDAAVSGAKCRDVDAAARKIIADAGYGEMFGHALGHGVGVYIHEEPRLSPKSEQTLCDGMVVTAEPGIYINGKFGVRIEDLLVINGEKPVNLSNFEKDLIII